MGTLSLRTLVLSGLAILALGVAACTRSASTPPPTAGVDDGTPGQMSSQQMTMEAVRSALLTQTAQAGGGAPVETETPGIPVGVTETPTPEPTSTSVIVASPTGGVPTSHTIQQGEHPYCLARRYNVNPDELLSLNGLTRSSFVFPGMTLKIPQTGNPFPGTRALLTHPTNYTVLSGDTIYSVACKYGDVDPLTIAAANGLASPYTLSAGSTISIP